MSLRLARQIACRSGVWEKGSVPLAGGRCGAAVLRRCGLSMKNAARAQPLLQEACRRGDQAARGPHACPAYLR